MTRQNSNFFYVKVQFFLGRTLDYYSFDNILVFLKKEIFKCEKCIEI